MNPTLPHPGPGFFLPVAAGLMLALSVSAASPAISSVAPLHPGRIGVVALSSAAEVNLVMPSNQAEAVRDAADSFRTLTPREFQEVAAGGAALGAAGGPGAVAVGAAIVLAIPVVVPVISGVAAAVGAVHAGLAAETEANLGPARSALQRAVQGVRLETLLRDRLLAELRRNSSATFVTVDEALLRDTDPDLPRRAWRQDVELRKKTRAAIAGRGIGTVLEIRVHAPALIGSTPLDPALALSARVRVRLVAMPSGLELHRSDTEYRGSVRHYAEWAAGGAALLRQEFDRCVANLGGDILYEIISHPATSRSSHGQIAAATPAPR